MGTWLIVQGLLVVTKAVSRGRLSDLRSAAKVFQEIAPAHRPYPKPTQVDW